MAKTIVPQGQGITEKNSGITPPSKLDLFSGKHTSSLIVGTLFVIALFCFIIYIKSISAADKEINTLIISGFFSLLSLLAGFFAGSKSKHE